MLKKAHQTINDDEIKKFSKLNHSWWDYNAEFKLLHIINTLRVEYINKCIINLNKNPQSLKLIDVGCGGGIFAESMSKLGFNVNAIDVCEESIKVAKDHSIINNLDINYRCTNIETLVENCEKYDVVVAMEVIEHVNDLEFFMQNLCNLMNDNGLIFISTINRTISSFLLAIVGAEYILRWLPRGMHKWSKFVKPSEVAKCFYNNKIKLEDMVGIEYNILSQKWGFTNDTSVNYIVMGNKIV